MSLGYVEELAVRYFEKQGYAVRTNTRFQLDKGKTKKKIAGWSDIDILAIKPDEVNVVQCKSVLGYKKGKEVVIELKNWFNYAIDYLKEDPCWAEWLKPTIKLNRILVIDYTVKGLVNDFDKCGIKIIYYDWMLRYILEKFASGKQAKQDDIIMRLLLHMVSRGFIKKEKLEQLACEERNKFIKLQPA